jgi:hypothetical protein
MSEKDLWASRPDRSREEERLIRRLKRKKPKDLDYHFKAEHNRAFSEISCLDCAHCCKTTGPLFTDKDIKRIASHQNLSPRLFEEKYLRIDEDGDRVLQVLPCPFLQKDNRCGIYDFRPKACREYPHTDRSRQDKILHLTQKNAKVCPAVYDILKRLQSIYGP